MSFFEEIQAAQRACGEVLEIDYTANLAGPILTMKMPEDANKRAAITEELCGPQQMKLIACADISGWLWYKFQRKQRPRG